MQLCLQGDVGAGVGKSPLQNSQSAQNDFEHTLLKPSPSLPFLTNFSYCLLHFDLQMPVFALGQQCFMSLVLLLLFAQALALLWALSQLCWHLPPLPFGS